MPGQLIYQCQVLPEWADYNGHLRDAYYALILSHAVDALMDRLGLDESYRSASRATLYTLETHMHFLHEVKRAEAVAVHVGVLASDPKRIHAGFELRCAGHADPAATAETMLLHVRQGDRPAAVPFPDAVLSRIKALQEQSALQAMAGPGSRKIALQGR